MTHLFGQIVRAHGGQMTFQGRIRVKVGGNGLFPLAVTMITLSMPASEASSTTYWSIGLSRMGRSSLGTDLVIGKNRVPSPAAGITAVLISMTPPDAGPFYHRSD